MLFSVLALAISALPGEQASYNITTLVESADCGPFRISNRDELLCDLSPAFARVEKELTVLPAGYVGYGPRTGAAVAIPAGRFFLSSTVRICRQMTISGAGGGDLGSATVLYAPKGRGGFRVAYFDECRAGGAGDGGVGTVIEKMAIVEAPSALVNDLPTSAIEINARAIVRDVFINGFVQGVRISAGVTRVPRSNANGWQLYNITIQNTEHAGLSVDGGDTNAGLAMGVGIKAGCKRGSSWKSLGVCSDFYINDFLGSTFVASRASGSVDDNTGENFANYAFLGDASQRAISIGGYSEGDMMPPRLGPAGMWLGGSAGAVVGGYHQVGPNANTIVLKNSKDPLNPVETVIGELAADGSGLDLIPINPMKPLRIKADVGSKAWRVDVANLNAGVAMRIGGTADAVGGYGAVNVPKELALGSGVPAVFGTSTGTPAVALCNRTGTVYLERNPSATGPVGYQCRAESGSWLWRSWR